MSSPNIWPIVTAWGEGQPPSPKDYQTLIDWELDDCGWKQASRSDTVKAIKARAQILQSLHRQAINLPLPGAWQSYTKLLWSFWLPFAQWLDARQKALNRPFIQGILGGQGAGKTTLTKGLSLILSLMGQTLAVLSIDDLYLPYCDRLKLQQLDPRLVWRGPPGTHDVELGLKTLNAIKNASPNGQISLPQFDKSLHDGQGDRLPPIHQPAPSILLFEGWFVGISPLDDALFADTRINLPTPIDTPADRQFARDMNQQLQPYQPLWEMLDSLAVLLLEDYRLSYDGRVQAEQKMRASGKPGLSDKEIASFVTYFWKALHPALFIEPLAMHSEEQPAYRSKPNLVVKVGQSHVVKGLYFP